MKNYIGVTIVKAKPGTLAEAQALKNRVPVETQERIFKKSGTANPNGYIVMDSEGKVSWSSKEEFEKKYKVLDCEDFIKNQQ